MRDRREVPEWREVRRGLVLLASVLAAALSVFFMDDLRRLLVEGPRLIVAAPTAAELERGAAVWIAGRPAGRVASVRLRSPDVAVEHRVIVEVVLDRTAAPMLRRDATAEIHPIGMMGEPVVGIMPGSPDAPRYDFTDTLLTPALMGRERLLTVLEELQRASERARPLAAELERASLEGAGTLPALRRDTALVTQLSTDLRRLGRVLDPGPEEGSLGRLAHDTAWRAALARTGERLRALEEGSPEAAAGLEELRAVVDALGTRLASMEEELEEGRGTAGRLLHDDELARQRALLETRLDSVRAELLKEPLRWLRFRLF